MTVTFGGVFAVVLPPTRPASLWAAIAVVRRPGATFVVDAHCRPNALWIIDMTAFKLMLTQHRTWGDPPLKLPLKAALDTSPASLLDSLYGQAETD